MFIADPFGHEKAAGVGDPGGRFGGRARVSAQAGEFLAVERGGAIVSGRLAVGGRRCGRGRRRAAPPAIGGGEMFGWLRSKAWRVSLPKTCASNRRRGRWSGRNPEPALSTSHTAQTAAGSQCSCAATATTSAATSGVALPLNSISRLPYAEG